MIHDFLRISAKLICRLKIRHHNQNPIFSLYRFHLSDGLSIKSIAALMKDDMTGADIYSVCSNAWLSAVRRIIVDYQRTEGNFVFFFFFEVIPKIIHLLLISHID